MSDLVRNPEDQFSHVTAHLIFPFLHYACSQCVMGGNPVQDTAKKDNLQLKQDHVSCVIRKPNFYICENKGADELCSNCKADQCLCFCYTDSTVIQNFKLHRSVCVGPGWKPQRLVFLRRCSGVTHTWNVLPSSLL